MKKLFLVISLVVLCVFSVFCQDYLDVVLTTDGDSFKGIIIENKVNQYVRIELPGGTIFRIDYTDIDTILKEKNSASTAERGESQSSTIVINNNQNQEQSTGTVQVASPATQTPSLNPYQGMELSHLFSDLSLRQLKDLRPDITRMNSTDPSVRLQIYESKKKSNAGGYMVGNLFIPGLGSAIQGDGGMAAYLGLSTVAYIVSFLSYYTTATTSYDYDGGPPPHVIITGINYIIAWAVGLFSPFGYQGAYNNELKTKLMVY